MANTTLTYSNRLQGWTSFFTFYPEWMVGMNNNFYTMKAGQLYRHRDNSVNRNTFYGVYGNSTITTVFNDNPIEAKMFKTIGLESTSAWTATLTTDMDTGSIASTYFVKKEADYYANIRRNSGNVDLDLMSAQGIGTCTAVSAAVVPNPVTITFPFSISSIVNVGDVAYNAGAAPPVTTPPTPITGTPVAIGTISSMTDTTITINVTTSIPIIGNVILGIKNAVAESYGSRGYYMETKLENILTTQVELFAVTSEAFKSYP